MVTLVNNLAPKEQKSPSSAGYDAPVKLDTSVPPKPKPTMPVVSVNGVVIPETEILEEAQNHPAKNPGKALRAAAQALVVKQLLLQQANELGLVATPELDDEGRPETEEDALIRMVIDAEMTVPTATDKECLRYYNNNKHRFSSDDIYQARHILLIASPKDTEARQKAKAQAQSLTEVLTDEPERFEQMAREMSACSSSQQGGNLGQITKGDTVAEFEAALETLREGELSAEPVETPYGFHIIALDKKIAGECLPFDHVSERISTWLQAASWSRAVSQYVSILAGTAKIEGIDLAPSDGPLVQ
ncbi:MAG: peptidylprolyl isomerase [Rhizobiaceae bacterium]|nr:peptidylprolyl isomerase [Rhizobiaceae bacterium]